MKELKFQINEWYKKCHMSAIELLIVRKIIKYSLKYFTISFFLNLLFLHYLQIFNIKMYILFIHCPSKVKVQPALLFSSFMHNSSINELKSMKLN